MDFLETLHARVVPCDGAMGTLLFARGIPRDSCLEELCASQPELIQSIHAEYLASGAQVIRTHSFGSNALRLARFGHERRVGELNWLAARIAREAVKGTGALVAASVGPCGLDPDETGDRVALFEEQMGGLLDGGADLVILETFTDLDELCDALEAKQTLHHCPVVALFTGTDPDRVAAAFPMLREAGADVVGINCAGDPRVSLAALAEADLTEFCCVFPSASIPEDAGSLARPLAAAVFAEGMEALIERGVKLVGGCCGSTPQHIEAMVDRLNLRPKS